MINLKGITFIAEYVEVSDYVTGACYLNSPDLHMPQLLIDLELTPNEVTDSDLPLFKQLIDDDEGCIQKIDEKYPLVMQQLRIQAASVELEQGQRPSDYDRILKSLENRVKGQKSALEIVAASLASQRTQSSDNYKFLFTGPTGTGKTELAKAIAALKNHMITFAMNQYPHESDSTLFFGAPTGYLGSDSRPILARELDACAPAFVRKNGNKSIYVVKDTVVLFDELEKAHPKTKQSLLSLFDEGTIDISYTKRDAGNVTFQYQLQNCIIICTSNLFQEQIRAAFEHQQSSEQIGQLFIQLNQCHPETGYSAEFLGRLRSVPFGPIPRGLVYQSLLKEKVEAFFNDYKNEMGFREIVIEPNQELQFYTLLEQKVYGNGTNIRNIKNYFEDIRAKVLANQNTIGDLANKKLRFTCNDQTIMIKFATFVYGKYVDVPVKSIEI